MVYGGVVRERKIRIWIPAPDQVEGRLCAGMTVVSPAAMRIINRFLDRLEMTGGRGD